MGVFDSIRDKIGVEDSEDEETRESGGEEAARQRTRDTGGAGEGADESPDPADDLQTHGNHWAALLPPEDRADVVQDLLETAIDEGEVVEGAPLDGEDVEGRLNQDGPLGLQAVSVGGEVVTGYPVADGVEQEVDVEQVGEWDSGVEAWLIGECGPGSLTAFASNYFELSDDDVGGPTDAEIAVVMYNVGEAEADTIQVEDEEIDVSDFAGFRPWEQGAPDDAVVRTTVESVEEVELAGHPVYRIEAPLVKQEDVETLDGVIYVADHVAGDYEPEAGDAIEGAAWIQASF